MNDETICSTNTMHLWAIFQQVRTHRACISGHPRSSPHRAPRLTALPTQAELPVGLRRESVPRHVAVVLDGNSRWARAGGLPQTVGHAQGLPALEEMVPLSRKWGIRVLTAFVFSHENWKRPKLEVDFLMVLFEKLINDNVEEFKRGGVRIRLIGDIASLPFSLQTAAKEAEEATRENSKLVLVLAVSYSGRRDIVQACRSLATKVHEKLLRPEEIDESLFRNELQTSFVDEFAYPDLLIRTSGELGLSNFLLWQTAYSELYFTNTLWPDFGEADYLQALISFQSRERRFGQRI